VTKKGGPKVFFGKTGGPEGPNGSLDQMGGAGPPLPPRRYATELPIFE